jgi:putative restriction endonuclease
MTYWWVNQNQTWQYEISGGFLWSPKYKRDGSRNQFHDNMQLVRANDEIFSYFSGFVQYVGVATGPAISAKKPANFGQPDQWDPDGWYVPVDWRTVGPINPREIIEPLRPHLPPKYSPLQSNGNGLQGVYLARLPEAMAQVLLAQIGWSSATVGRKSEAYSAEQFTDARPCAPVRQHRRPKPPDKVRPKRRGESRRRASQQQR